jgi:hypothetical protein
MANPSALKNNKNWNSTSLPAESIFLLKETCYWYQTVQDGSSVPVSKEIALKILCEDIQHYLKKL